MAKTCENMKKGNNDKNTQKKAKNGGVFLKLSKLS